MIADKETMSNLKIILTKNIDQIGKKGDVKKVAIGYAKNFLIPKKMAVLATASSLKDLEQQKEIEAKQAEEELALYQEVASQLDGLEIEILAKIGEDGKLFGSITAAKIAEKLKKKGFELKKDQIKLAEPIKEIGEYDISAELPHGLEVKIKVIIIEENPKEQNQD